MSSLKIFEAYGIEAEYMIVDRKNLSILSKAEDILIHLNGGTLSDEVCDKETCVSNELVSHVIEIKGNGPQRDLEVLAKNFHNKVLLINSFLESFGACLMPGAMHPTLDPIGEIKLWPHGQKEIYETYDRIFSCKGHGWSNVQSVHLNLPFSNEEEFVRLHAAIRVVLPLIPLLSASSPFYEGKWGPRPSNRLHFYQHNQAKIPSITGDMIPEVIHSYQDYQNLYQKIYADISPFDPKGVLQHPWLNSRGAIAKLDCKAIEMRLIDIQECVSMDFAIISFIVEILKDLVSEKFTDLETQHAQKTELLKKNFMDLNQFSPPSIPSCYANLFGINASSPVHPRDFLLHLIEQYKQRISKDFQSHLLLIANQGHLAQRIKSLAIQHSNPEAVFKQLSLCLQKGIPLQE